MVIIESQILVVVPRPVCFDLARTIEVHAAAEAQTRERVVSGRTAGVLDLGDSVTFEAVHFGVRQRLTSKIVAMDAPCYFVDEMQRGAFQFMRHTHTFADAPFRGTLMTDRLEFAAPLGVLGIIAEALFLKRYMARFIERHQQNFRSIVEEGLFDVRNTD